MVNGHLQHVCIYLSNRNTRKSTQKENELK